MKVKAQRVSKQNAVNGRIWYVDLPTDRYWFRTRNEAKIIAFSANLPPAKEIKQEAGL